MTDAYVATGNISDLSSYSFVFILMRYGLNVEQKTQNSSIIYTETLLCQLDYTKLA